MSYSHSGSAPHLIDEEDENVFLEYELTEIERRLSASWAQEAAKQANFVHDSSLGAGTHARVSRCLESCRLLAALAVAQSDWDTMEVITQTALDLKRLLVALRSRQ